MLFTVGIVVLAYFTYGTYISRKLGINSKKLTPAHEFKDNLDYVPTNRMLVLGHHFASIAGVGPIVGPILATAFGWLPVFLWILIGGIFIGAVHDLASTMASLRHQGKSIGEIISRYIGETGKKLFIIFGFCTMLLVIAVFTNITADTFTAVPEVATASIFFIFLAIAFGLALRRLKLPFVFLTILGVVLLFSGIWLGNKFPLVISENAEVSVNIWRIVLLFYIFISAVLPIWILIQPRDYLNSFLLYAIMIGGIVGIFILKPDFNLDAYSGFKVEMGANGDMVFLFPILFVTVACGAISGFHSLVASGTTSKQLNNEKDAKIVAYGGMLIEIVLAALAVIAVASLAVTDFREYYSAGQFVAAFAHGIGSFMEAIPFLNISAEAGMSFAALAVSAFALTSLDTCCRLSRYLFQEYFDKSKNPKIKRVSTNRYLGTLIAVTGGAMLVFSGSASALWPVFGSANQLLAALALLAVSAWLSKKGKKNLFIKIPMIIMFAVTITALVNLAYNNWVSGNYLLFVIALVLLALAVVLIKSNIKAKIKLKSI